MKWGNVNISKKTVGKDGKIMLEGAVDLDDKDFSKKVKKITWLVVDPNTNVEVELVDLDQLITEKQISPLCNHPDMIPSKRDQMK